MGWFAAICKGPPREQQPTHFFSREINPNSKPNPNPNPNPNLAGVAQPAPPKNTMREVLGSIPGRRELLFSVFKARW
jgi:hypothetical protein